MSDDTRTPETDCPACGVVLDAASPMPGTSSAPSPGDLSICIGCGVPLVFRGNLTVRAIKDRELQRLPLRVRAELRHAQAAVRTRNAMN